MCNCLVAPPEGGFKILTHTATFPLVSVAVYVADENPTTVPERVQHCRDMKQGEKIVQSLV